MFKLNTQVLSFIVLVFALNSQAQNTVKSFKDANNLILEGSMQSTSVNKREFIEKQTNDFLINAKYNDGISFWKQALAKEPNNANLNYKLGLCYFFSYDQQLKALPYFKQAVKSMTSAYDFNNEKEIKAPSSAFYFLAETYLENNKPDSAIKYFTLYQDNYQTTPISTELGLAMSLNAKESNKNPRNVQVSNMGNVVNTPYAETNPVMRLDNKLLFFSSRRPSSKEKSTDTEKLFNADIYYSIKNESGKWDNAIPFKFNTNDDEAPLYLSPNGDVMYFRRTTGGNTDIFKTEYKNNAWTKPEPVSEINTNSNETGLSISGDGKTMFYCSDQNKVAGKYDIFKCVKQKNGKWGQIEILSSTINTPFNEVSPYVTPDGRALFFATNGSSKKGVGGYDIYYSELKMDNTWTEPTNMGYPINKTRTDINYYVASDDKRYYASLTENNSYDIFLVEGGGFDFENIAAGTDIVTVTNEMGVTQVMETEKKVEKEVEVVQAVETIVEKEKEVTMASDADLNEKKDIKVSDVNVDNLSESDRKELIEKVKDYLLEQLKANESVKFKVVYFDFNKSNLNLLSLNELKLLVEFLNEHPETKIEIAGHGDNKGSWETNLGLSNKRAKEVYDFLITNKVSPNRMFFYGKGSAVPIAPNDTDENRGKNRRVEVFILK